MRSQVVFIASLSSNISLSHARTHSLTRVPSRFIALLFSAPAWHSHSELKVSKSLLFKSNPFPFFGGVIFDWDVRDLRPSHSPLLLFGPWLKACFALERSCQRVVEGCGRPGTVVFRILRSLCAAGRRAQAEKGFWGD